MPSTTLRPIAKFVQAELAAKADARKAKEMAAYMKTEMPFYGVQKPDRLPIYRQLKNFRPQDQAEYEENVLALWALPHREEKYAAMEYALMFASFLTPASMVLYEHLIRSGAWWDFVDAIAINLVGHAYRDNRSILYPTIENWTDDEDMWIRRTSLICHNHHKKETDEEQLFRTCLKLCSEKEFFIRKAIGWALREYSYVAPHAVHEFVLKHKAKFAPLTVREATKRLVRAGIVE